ncbi:transglutaminase-like cysteine peptidase [Rhizobium sp. C1]|uniref:transglutaminase-like cysteine peptidase n=1 Tax=Rhizobium sp. C1 TaxID=1349799 RepID=UPI001E417948|nr:transglutaminase-like cysteine peptidase [Rhizobium sp. C1]MCD2178062.1 transglutaminase-like cysteine peptidase [Rhizobium sp. C1]
MRKLLNVLIGFVMASAVVSPVPASAFTLGSMTRNLGGEVNRQFISVESRTVGPYAGVVFCMQNPQECATKRTRRSHIEISLNERRFAMLEAVNQSVNGAIRPENDSAEAGGDVWSLSPVAGDCEDYAITKRHELIARGWPANTLRMAVVYTAFGEGHMVLVVKTNSGDLVLDNRVQAIRRWDKTGLKWVMIQSSSNPKKWMTVAGSNV